MAGSRKLAHYAFSGLTLSSAYCELSPTQDIESFRGLFTPTDWRLMFGDETRVAPSCGETLYRVLNRLDGNVIGFIRVLFAEREVEGAEFHCGFRFETFQDKRAAAVAGLMMLQRYFHLVGGDATARVNVNNPAAARWAERLGFSPRGTDGDYRILRHHGRREVVDAFLHRLGVSRVTCSAKSGTVRLATVLLRATRVVRWIS